jgi:ABC-type oligopeptide transport system ATPase subunit
VTPLLEVRDLVKDYPAPGSRFWRPAPRLRAVDGVSLAIEQGETFGLVGESGSGKTTLGRCVLRLLDATSGSVRFDGQDLMAVSPRRLKRLRRDMQIVFQDPYAALNASMPVGEIIEEPLVVHRVGGTRARKARVEELLHLVGLDPAMAHRYPREFSGGQRQRISVARALALTPSFIIADEPVSALDVSVQAQIVNLLLELQRQLSLTYLFIAHDLPLVQTICNRVGVMYRGRIVETGQTSAVFAQPAHPYTQALLAAANSGDPREVSRRTETWSELDVRAPLRELAEGHWAAV